MLKFKMQSKKFCSMEQKSPGMTEGSQLMSYPLRDPNLQGGSTALSHVPIRHNTLRIRSEESVSVFAGCESNHANNFAQTLLKILSAKCASLGEASL